MKLVAVTLALLLALPVGTFAQEPQAKPLSQAELEQILAPVALYPDDVLSQILIASTYPLEIVQADRWAKQNSGLKGDALTVALEKQPWDPSVKSLVNFPQVLGMMSEKIDLTQKVGDAFLAQRQDVMKAVQSLRAKAQASGNLKTTKEQQVIVEKETIVIQPANPEVVYVPTYNPTVVYGTWPYPAYPPYYYYPPSYYAGAAFVGFAAGVAVGAAWGYAWGHCNWGGGDIDIDVNRNTNINRNIDRSKYQRGQGGRGSWQHNPSHRGGVAYRDRATASKYNRGASPSAVQSRQNYRGRSEGVQRDLGRSGTGQRPSAGQMDRSAGADRRGSASQMDRTRGSASERGTGVSQRDSGRSSAFSGMDRGSSAKDFSSRGSQSRQSMSRGSSSGGFGGGSMGSGSRGGSFGGGSRGGGGRRR